MSTLFANSRKQKTYGWDLELTCTRCRNTGLPRYEGWSQNLQTNTGAGVRVYAKVACPKCGNRLTNEAGSKLVDIFRSIELPEKNKKIMKTFIAGIILVPFVLAFVLLFGTQMDWWGWGLGTVWILVVSAVAIPLLVLQKNKEIGKLAGSCGCGKPHQVFLGSLDDADCYRCFSCGRLMKLRE